MQKIYIRYPSYRKQTSLRIFHWLCTHLHTHPVRIRMVSLGSSIIPSTALIRSFSLKCAVSQCQKLGQCWAHCRCSQILFEQMNKWMNEFVNHWLAVVNKICMFSHFLYCGQFCTGPTTVIPGVRWHKEHNLEDSWVWPRAQATQQRETSFYKGVSSGRRTN